ncbi:MAG: non-homologous end-joining DNA ligase [Actinobacteria bacterium]|nr:non-homologous end-joining DNA ligase [Actinomycetota bacterium]
MRQPVFLGLRDDKPASSVFQEKPEPITISNAIKVEITNPNKIFWPQEGFTKKDLADYYKNIADFILPYLDERPQSLNRCPDGINGECFFQKDIEHELPGWLKTEKIFSESKNKDINYLVCSGIDSLLYMVNLGCIEMNPWNSRIGKLDNPDYAVLDLDPLNVSFSDVVKVALNVKHFLDKIGIVGFCKTSGATGIHIYLPLEAKYSYEQTLDFTKILATIVNENIPELTSLERAPDKRRQKVYIDCYQNRIGQTMVTPYSVRPRELAPVSTPLRWNELNNNLNPSNFTIKNIFNRLEKFGDLWNGVLGHGIDLEKCINSLYRIYNIR